MKNLIALLAALVLFAPVASAGEKTTRQELPCGLRVVLRPVAGAQDVCVLVLFDVGGDHDPEGRSGLAHLIEHLYVTSAAGDVPARTADEMMKAYPMRWNAQTGDDYTVIAFVEKGEDLPDAIREAAARMTALQITDAEIEREKGRVIAELSNMYRAVPLLAARNRARALVRPRPSGGRRGGLPAEVSALEPDVIRRRVREVYVPAHARLVVTGGFDVEAARALIRKAFTGKPASPLPPVTPPPPSPTRLDESTSNGPGPGQVALAFRAPPPGDPSYPAFLFLVSRLYAAGPKLLPTQILYTPLDDPAALVLLTPLTDRHADTAAMRKVLHGLLEKAPSSFETVRVVQTFGFLLGTRTLLDRQLAYNPYGLAFRLGRMDQFGIDPLALRRQLQEVTAKDLATLEAGWLSGEHGAVATVVPAR